MSLCYFVGVLYPNTVGHYIFLNGRSFRPSSDLPRTPWCSPSNPMPVTEFSNIVHAKEEPEGTLYTEQAGAWTLIACWDRSADARGASSATFAAQTTDIAEALASIREHYARTLARIEAHVGKPIEAWPRVALSDAYPQAPLSKARRACCPTCKGSGVAP